MPALRGTAPTRIAQLTSRIASLTSEPYRTRLQQRKCTVFELHRDAAERPKRLLQLEQLEFQLGFGSEHLAGRHAKDQRVPDLSGRARHRYLNSLLHAAPFRSGEMTLI